MPSGNLPMFTRVQATTGKRAIKAFIERWEPVKGWFLAKPEDITDRRRRRRRGKQTADREKAELKPTP
jgi:hypothetical protein